MKNVLQFFFPTPFTPQPIETMDVPYGAVGTGDRYNVQTYGERVSGVRWSEIADYDELHADENAPHYAGPLQYAHGPTLIQAGGWKNRRGPG